MGISVQAVRMGVSPGHIRKEVRSQCSQPLCHLGTWSKVLPGRPESVQNRVSQPVRTCGLIHHLQGHPWFRAASWGYIS